MLDWGEGVPVRLRGNVGCLFLSQRRTVHQMTDVQIHPGDEINESRSRRPQSGKMIRPSHHVCNILSQFRRCRTFGSADLWQGLDLCAMLDSVLATIMI
jgi:hypothetical protein